MKKSLLTFALTGLLVMANNAAAFCGFYVAKADTDLFNEASKVVLVRDGDRTVITMASDYEGDPKEFAMVIPVPTVLQEEQIHVTENKIIDHLDAYTAPRLVEYFDDNPCQQIRYEMMDAGTVMSRSPVMQKSKASAKKLGVTIEAEYTVGEYDILILSAKESDGLETWLKQNGYKIPKGANEVLGSYIKQGTKFFVAKVNLEEKAKLGVQYLRPLQMAFETDKFMLPIRLGTVNSKGEQELFVFTLTKKGRVETTNYRTTKIPSNMDIPVFAKEEFSDFYKDMFTTATEKENGKAVFLEYAWDMNWCDPCAADPLSDDELQELGVFWLPNNNMNEKPQPMRSKRIAPQAKEVFVTRLHVRYNGERFPEDLKFQETSDRENFQGRYVLRHPWTGNDQCQAATQYRQSLPERFNQEAKTLANLTGWDINEIRKKMQAKGASFDPDPEPKDDTPWWKKIWKK